MCSGSTPRSVAWDPNTRSYSVEGLRTVHRRLRIFSWVKPWPKEPYGDSLRIAWRVEDTEAGTALLAGFGLVSGWDLQRPEAGPFAGSTVVAHVDRWPMDERGDRRMDEVVALVRLWNEAATFDVTNALVDQAVVVEGRLAAMRADLLPRETRLLSWVTRDSDPDAFGD